jgi:hypothetical protein
MFVVIKMVFQDPSAPEANDEPEVFMFWSFAALWNPSQKLKGAKKPGGNLIASGVGNSDHGSRLPSGIEDSRGTGIGISVINVSPTIYTKGSEEALSSALAPVFEFPSERTVHGEFPSRSRRYEHGNAQSNNRHEQQ